jgi:hypothetical protein
VTVDSFSDEITHFVCSNASAKRLKAAAIFEVAVVNPSWVQSCLQSGTRACEEDFALGKELTVIPITEVVKPKPDLVSSKADKSISLGTSAERILSADNATPQNVNISSVSRELGPSIDISKSVSSAIEKKAEALVTLSKKGKSTGGQIELVKKKVVRGADTASIAAIENSTAKLSSESCKSSSKQEEKLIPLPSYKELKAVVLPPSMRSQRRSERICDNEESQETIPEIDVNASLPIVRSDSPVIPQVSHSVIKDITMPIAGKKRKINSEIKVSSAATDEIVQKADTKASTAVSPKNSKRSSSTAESVPEVEGSSRMSDILAAGIVIAVSGFDEIGEKATMTNSLAQFINSVNEKSSSDLATDNGGISSSSSSSSSSSKKMKTGAKVEASKGLSVVLLDTEEDPFGLHCTHVVLQSTSSK